MSAPILKPMDVEEDVRTEEQSPVKREYGGGFVSRLPGPTLPGVRDSRERTLITEGR